MKRLLTIFLFSVLFICNSAYAIPDQDEPKDQPLFKNLPEAPIGTAPFFVEKPTLCQNGPAFIAILEQRQQYRVFMGAGQLVSANGEKTGIMIFTAANFDDGGFTIFEWHQSYGIACILAVGQGFQILELPTESTSTVVMTIYDLSL